MGESRWIPVFGSQHAGKSEECVVSKREDTRCAGECTVCLTLILSGVIFSQVELTVFFFDTFCKYLFCCLVHCAFWWHFLQELKLYF